MPVIIFIVVLVVFVLIILSQGVRIVNQQQVMIIEKLGRYDRTLSSGLNIIIPGIDSPRAFVWKTNRGTFYSPTIDLRESVFDFPSQKVITKDNIVLEINAIIYLQITDPVKAIYEIANLPEAVEKLTQTSLRNVIGDLDLDGTLTSRDHINTQLKSILDEASNKWGLKVNRVEIQDIIPPKDIIASMEKQMRAERDRRAAILEADATRERAVRTSDGDRQAQIQRAEGEKQAKILEAEGQAQARLAIAKAEAESILIVVNSAGSSESALNYLVALKYIEAFTKISEGQANTVFMPYESSSLLSSVGGIKELFSKVNK